MPDHATSHRLRIGRYSESNRTYLITTNTHERVPIFSDFHLGRLVVWQFRLAQYQGLANSLAWVVMPDHFHWLIELKKGSLGDLLCQVKSKSTRTVNGATGRKGRLWQTSFHDRALRQEDDLVKMARYVVANPLRAGLVKRIGDYPLWDAVWVQSRDRVAAFASKPAPTLDWVHRFQFVNTVKTVGAGLLAKGPAQSPQIKQKPPHPPTTPPPQSR